MFIKVYPHFENFYVFFMPYIKSLSALSATGFHFTFSKFYEHIFLKALIFSAYS